MVNLQQLINAHPKGVRLLLSEYNITAEPTPEVLQSAYSSMGEPFLHKLFEISELDQENSFEGKSLKDTLPVAKEKQSRWGQFKGWFDNITNKVERVSELTKGINDKFVNPQINENMSDAEKAALQYEPQKEKETAKTALIVGVVIVFVLFLVLILVKTKR